MAASMCDVEVDLTESLIDNMNCLIDRLVMTLILPEPD